MSPKIDKVMVYGVESQCTKFHNRFDHVIINSFMTNKKPFNSNSTSPMDTKLDRVVWLMTWTDTQKITSLLVKNSFHS